MRSGARRSARHIALFAALTPDPQPFAPVGDWTQLPDALHFDGSGFAGLTAPLVGATQQTTVGLDLYSVVGATTQHQIALSPNLDITGTATYFIELDELPGVSRAAVSHHDRSGGYAQLQTAALPDGLHAGRITLAMTQIAGTSVGLDGGWPGETYHLVQPAPDSTNATQLEMNPNNVVADLRYVFVVATD